MQAALWVVFLLMLAQGLLGWFRHGDFTTVEAIAVVCFALGFAVMSIGFPITVARWRRAKRAERVSSGA